MCETFMKTCVVYVIKGEREGKRNRQNIMFKSMLRKLVEIMFQFLFVVFFFLANDDKENVDCLYF